MTFKEYQENTKKTAVYDKKYRFIYPPLGLAGEAGEVAEKFKKAFRDNDGVITEERKEEISKELGDVLWYVSQISTELDLDMGEVAKKNLEKLFSRKNRGKLSGDGDNR
jgi:NTP pyrophosphatase (non-canonical NTP hydrolase)